MGKEITKEFQKTGCTLNREADSKAKDVQCGESKLMQTYSNNMWNID